MTAESLSPPRQGQVSRRTWILCGLALLLAGPAGLLVTCFVLTVRMAPPTSIAGRRWRTLGLATGWTAVVFGAVGGVVGLVRGLEYPPTAVVAIVEGGTIGAVPGMLLGALIGGVLVLVQIIRSALA